MSSIRAPRGPQLGVGRRGLLGTGGAVAAACLFGRPVRAAEAYEALRPQWEAAKIDWQQRKGTLLVLGAEQHPWTDAITPLLPYFERLSGIRVRVQVQSEAEFTADMPVRLGAGNPTPDVFMIWALGQAIAAHWLEPLDPMMRNLALTDVGWWDDADVFGSARSFQTGPDGQSYVLAITAEAQTLFANQPLLQAKGLAVPATMDQLLAAAKALKTPDVAGIAMRARATGDAGPWPAGGFVFTYGGAIMTPHGEVALNRPEAVAAIDMYGRLLREAGPVGVSNYHWMECLNDFMSGAVAMGLDSSNFATDIANPGKSEVAGKAVYGAFPTAGHAPAKPNMWHWTAGINSRSANQDAAWLFLSWATSKPTCLLLAASGLATPRSSAWRSDAFRKRFGAQAAEAALANLKAADASLMKAAWFHPKAPQILDPFGIAINETVTGAKTAQAALDDAAKKIHAALG